MTKTAVILAAGAGSRLKERTDNKPKGFLRLGENPIIEESVSKLFGYGIEKILIGTGHFARIYELLGSKYPEIECVLNARFRDTGSMYTLYNLREKIKDDFLLLESDLIYEKRGIGILLKDRHKDVILASGETDSGDEVYIEADEHGYLINLSKNKDVLSSIYAELVGITKISIDTFYKMCIFAEARFKKEPTLDYEYALSGISKENKIFVRKVEGYVWCEIDDESHLQRAKKIIYPKIKTAEVYAKD